MKINKLKNRVLKQTTILGGMVVNMSLLRLQDRETFFTSYLILHRNLSQALIHVFSCLGVK